MSEVSERPGLWSAEVARRWMTGGGHPTSDRIRGIAFDIDDTFSTHGQISAEAFTALSDLKKAGFWLVPVTGRPAGWCDHIARFWPVDAVIGENGAFFIRRGIFRIEWITPRDGLSREVRAERRAHLQSQLRAQFPGLQFASDQAYRVSDLAVDFCEDVAPWEESKILALEQACREAGAVVKRSSIHVNTWYGDFDKAFGFEAWLASEPRAPQSLETWIYLGDSPNDEPQFAHFSKSVGVANLKPFLNTLQHPPAYLTTQEAGAGFCEVAQDLLAALAPAVHP